MATTLPIPIEFTLPDGWRSAPPDDVGAPGSAFIALHPGSQRDGFTANVTVGGGYRPDHATLAEIADESQARLAEVAQDVTVSRRDEFGTSEAPGLTQAVNLSGVHHGPAQELVQSQVLLAMHDLDDPRRRVVVELALTATPAQLDEVIADFQQLVATVRPETSAPAEQ